MRSSENVFFNVLFLICWVVAGLFYLLYCVSLDLFNFLKILFDYKEEGDENTIKDAEDEMQDKIVIYNEVIDTVRAIMNIFRYYKRLSNTNYKKNQKRKAWFDPVNAENVHREFGLVKQTPKDWDKNYEPLLLTSNQYDLLEELQRENDEHEPEEGYTIDKNLILKAWKRFRPVNKPELEQIRGATKRISKISTEKDSRIPRTKQNKIKDIFGEYFT